MNNNIYRLKNGKKKGLWQLPINGFTAIKKVNGEDREKPIQYIKGADSIFIEDHEKTAKPKKVWFEDGELVVPKTDWALNEILRTHRLLNVDFELVDEEKSAKASLQQIKDKNEVTSKILNEADPLKIKSMAMVILGLDAQAWGDNKCKEQLLNYAEKHAPTLLAEIKKPGYEARLLSALAFNAKVVKNNATHTAVVWADSEGVIVRVAQGEQGLDKLGTFLSEGTDAALTVMQEIGIRVDKNAVMQAAVKPKTEAELRAEIRAELLAEQQSQNKKMDAPVNDADSGYDRTSIDAVRKAYAEIVGKTVPPNMNQNLEWMNGKIDEVLKATAA